MINVSTLIRFIKLISLFIILALALRFYITYTVQNSSEIVEYITHFFIIRNKSMTSRLTILE